MLFYHPTWIKEPFKDNKGNMLFQLNSAEITELNEALHSFLTMTRIAINWAPLVIMLR